jgi:hypothetical protein
LNLIVPAGTTGHQECSLRQLPQTECLKYFFYGPTRIGYDPHCLGGQCLLKGPRNRTANEHMRAEMCDAFGSQDKPRFIDADFTTANLSVPFNMNQEKAFGYVHEG